MSGRPRHGLPRVGFVLGFAAALVLGLANLAGASRTGPVATPPTNVSPPTIAGVAQQGQILRAKPGLWRPKSRSLELSYRWEICVDGRVDCTPVPRANDGIFALRPGDLGRSVRLVVTASNEAGSMSAASARTAYVGPAPDGAPQNLLLPAISGTLLTGMTLTAKAETWSGRPPVRLLYHWRRCDDDGGPCEFIGLRDDDVEKGRTYTLRAEDAGRTLRVLVIAENAFGTSAALSNPTTIIGPVPPKPPRNTSLPTIAGVARQGATLTASSGTWASPQPTRLSFQWLRCSASGGACESIPRATTRMRALTSDDVGHTMRVRVTATNSRGSTSATSRPTALVTPGGDAPRNAARPTLFGTPLQGERLTLTTGSWTGTRPIAYSYEWVRCGPALAKCAAVRGATGSRYVVSRADVGNRLIGAVIARNRFGASRAQSNATPVILGVPLNMSLPTISGGVMEGEMLTVTPGSWTSPAPISFGYQWTRCSAEGDFASCVPIVVTSRPTYRLTAADVGHRLFAQVKALNKFGASYVNSLLTPVVAAAPVGTLTIAAIRHVVTYGYRVALSGVLVNGRPREQVALIERPFGSKARTRSNAAVTSATGVWSCFARPLIRTTYQAQVRGRTSTIITVAVRPRLRLGRVAPGRFSLRVFAARSFAGRFAVVQRWNRDRHRWVGIKRIYLRGSRLGVEPTVVSRATFRLRADRGRFIRVLLPTRRSGPGYLQGTSNRVRT